MADAPNDNAASPTAHCTHHFAQRLLLPLAVLVAVAVIAVGGLLLYTVDRQNDQAKMATQQMSASLVGLISDQMGRITLDHSWWTEAYNKLVVDFDADWADSNVGPYVYDAFGYTASFVIGPDDRLIYGSFEGERSQRSPTNLLGTGLNDMVARARATEMAEPLSIVAFLAGSDGVHLVGVSTVSDESWSDTNPPSVPRAVLVYARRIDMAFLRELAEGFPLDSLHFEDDASNRHTARLALRDISGAPVGYLAWSPPQPGSAFIELAAPWLIALVLIVAISLTLIIRNVTAAARAMEGTTAELAVRNAALLEQQSVIDAARAEAEVANQAKTRLLANVSHELRTPLDAVIGFSDLMQSLGPQKNVDEKFLEYAGNINESGKHLLALIDDLIDVARIEVGALPLDERTLDTGEVVGFCRRMIDARARDAQLTFEACVVDPAPLLRADERRLRQILLNLLTNAVKYTPEGGRVMLEVTLAEDGGVQFVIADTGPGITDDEIERMLQPFQRGDKAHIGPREGAGLGLALVSGLVQEHDGTLTIENMAVGGTRATVQFPAVRTVDPPSKKHAV